MVEYILSEMRGGVGGGWQESVNEVGISGSIPQLTLVRASVFV